MRYSESFSQQNVESMTHEQLAKEIAVTQRVYLQDFLAAFKQLQAMLSPKASHQCLLLTKAVQKILTADSTERMEVYAGAFDYLLNTLNLTTDCQEFDACVDYLVEFHDLITAEFTWLETEWSESPNNTARKLKLGDELKARFLVVENQLASLLEVLKAHTNARIVLIAEEIAAIIKFLRAFADAEIAADQCKMFRKDFRYKLSALYLLLNDYSVECSHFYAAKEQCYKQINALCILRSSYLATEKEREQEIMLDVAWELSQAVFSLQGAKALPSGASAKLISVNKFLNSNLYNDASIILSCADLKDSVDYLCEKEVAPAEEVQLNIEETEIQPVVEKSASIDWNDVAQVSWRILGVVASLAGIFSWVALTFCPATWVVAGIATCIFGLVYSAVDVMRTGYKELQRNQMVSSEVTQYTNEFDGFLKEKYSTLARLMKAGIAAKNMPREEKEDELREDKSQHMEACVDVGVDMVNENYIAHQAKSMHQ